MLTMIKLNRRWWLELLIIVNYLRNRVFVANRNIILYEIWMNSSSSLSHIRSIDKFEYVLNQKLVINWTHKKSRDSLIMFIEFQKDHIYKMMHSDDKLKMYFKINRINDSWRGISISKENRSNLSLSYCLSIFININSSIITSIKLLKWSFQKEFSEENVLHRI